MMTRTLLLHCTQPFAQYRNPFTFYYAQTFPLPPKSTIIGMLQNATGKYYCGEFWKLQVSIHGGFESVFWNYSCMIKGDVKLMNGKLMNKVMNKEFPLYGDAKTSQRTPINMQELYNGHLWIFIRADEGFPYWNKLKQALEAPSKVLCLGRTEDVIFIQKVQEISPEGEETIKKSLWTHYPTYLRSRDRHLRNIPLKNKKYPVYSIPIQVIFKNNGKPIESKTELTKKTERDTQFKTLIYAGLDSAFYLDGQIEAEIFRVDGNTFTIPVKYGWI